MKRNNSFSHWRAILCALLWSGASSLMADELRDLQNAINEANAAQADAAANAPDQPTTKGREDALDRATRANEDFQPDPSKADVENANAKKALEEAQATAQRQADAAREMARDKAQAGRYREALARRRAARKALAEAKEKARRLLGSMNRREVEQMINRAHRIMDGLDDTLPAPATDRPSVSSLRSANKVSVEIAGTGKTIGVVAKLMVKNKTPEKISFAVPAMVLESISGKNQHYGCPQSQIVDLGPNEQKTVPIEGVCLVRGKPPVADGVAGDLAMNDANPKSARDPSCKMATNDADKFLRIATSIYQAADQLLKDGALEGIPYSDPKKKKDIAVQWSTWTHPEISKMTGAPPATKDDLKKVVYKQVEEKGPMTSETKKKVDQGIDTIFEKVELTTAKAKDLETPSELASGTGSTIDIADTQSGPDGTPVPTEERKKKPKIKWPQPIQDWIDQKKAVIVADQIKKNFQDGYAGKRKEFFDQSRYHRELEEKRKTAEDKAKDPKATKADKDNFDKADRELKELEKKLEQDFVKTKEGERALRDVRDAEKAADAAHAREAEAGKNIDPATKAVVEEQVDWSEPVEGVW